MPRPRPTPATPFGLWLDQWLQDHPEFTLHEFGRQVGVSKSAVSLWITKREPTKIPVPRLREVARVTGEPIENLERLVYGRDAAPSERARPAAATITLTPDELEAMLQRAAERAVRQVLEELEEGRASEGPDEPPPPSPPRSRPRSPKGEG